MWCMSKISAGLLMYRMKGGKPEVFLVHPGGPFFQNKDYWGIPKGELLDGEDTLVAACREFKEETSWDPAEPFTALGSVVRPDKKTIHAWAFLGDHDPALLVSNTCEIDWPPRSGRKMTIPEIDRGEYYPLKAAKLKISACELPFLELLEDALLAKKQ